MAHKVETMAYANQVPWHGLGTQVEEGISAEDMVKSAKLGWKVALRDLYFRTGRNEKEYGVPRRHALIRTDRNEVLDIVGNRWNPVQNIDVVRFFQEYVSAGDAHIETAGSLDGGKLVWALAKLNASFKLPGNDVSEGYVLLANPHQYGKSLIAKLTAVRVVCNNTLTMALRGGTEVRLSHNRVFDAAAQQAAKTQLGIAREKFDAMAQVARRLARMTLTSDDVTRISSELLRADNPLATLEEQPRTVRRIVSLYDGEGQGSQLKSAKGTAWGLLNAVTEYVDHEYGHNPNNRLSHAWFGRGEALKRRASETLLALTE